MVVLSRGRVVALVVVVLVALAAVTVAITSANRDGGGTSVADVPEGGSSFGGDGDGSGRTFLEALAPMLAGREEDGASAPAGAVSGSEVAAPTEARTIPARRLAQLFLVGFRGKSIDDPFVGRLTRRRWGAVIVDGANFADRAQLTALTERLRTAVPGGPAPLVVAGQGGGDDNALRDLGPVAQRTVASRAEARDVARAAAGRLRAVGVRMTLGPSADLGYSGGAWDGRAFGDDPANVDRRVSGAIAGWKLGGVAPAVGHFPGEGGASQDPSDGPATVGSALPELQQADVRAFRSALKRAPALVLSNALYAAFDGVTPATLLPQVPALARRSGFGGTIVSGNLAATVLATGGSVASAAVQALKAGSDLLWIPGDAADQEAAFRAVVRAVRRGEIPEARVREALANVARLKGRYAARGRLGRGGTSVG
ncbi:MAG: hypothetical protein JWP18_668 [Solirubrobacterales bacterium]|nr:hypothetical protein [Solirubrobacterales bacterium]